MSELYDLLKKNPDMKNYLGVYFSNTTRARRQLFSFTIQLLPLCNLQCKMCYARMTPDEIQAEGRHILSFEEWKPLIDEFAENGVFSASFTGGECTLHPDFCKIYSYCYDKGMSASILTNGTHITDEIFTLWTQKPPSSLYITLYGASAETYEKLCNNRNAFEDAYRNIRRLKEYGFNVAAQYTAVKDNIDDLFQTYLFTKELGIGFNHTSMLSDFDRCSSETIDANGIDDEEYARILDRIRCDAAGIEYTDDYVRPETFSTPHSNVPEKGIFCGAARNACYINWRGDMQPCVTLDGIVRHPLVDGLMNCWKDISEWACDVPSLAECERCIFRSHCLTCVAAHFNDTGKMGVVSPRLCWKVKYPQKAAEAQKRYDDLQKKRNVD